MPFRLYLWKAIGKMPGGAVAEGLVQQRIHAHAAQANAQSPTAAQARMHTFAEIK